MAAAAWVAPWAAGCSTKPKAVADDKPRFPSDPFTLGVASGSPRADGVVLWTRLATMPLAPDGGLEPVPVEVRWEVASDERFRSIVRSGATFAVPEHTFAVHVEVDGLAPARMYWYRFHAGGATSPVGRTITAPAADADPSGFRFAFASCQHFEHGFYGAYRHMLADEPQLVVFLGDYIYEGNARDNPVRRHAGPEPMTLEAYRLRHAQYKTDPDLQRMHAAAPFVVTWDDHEVDNDYADDRAEDLAPHFLARRAAAYRAYFEHMPLRGLSRPGGPHAMLYGRHDFGRLLRLHVLDDRQYRDYQACAERGRGGSRSVENCEELAEPSRSMLGQEQEQWLAQGLALPPARWNLIAQQTLFCKSDSRAGPGERFWTDGWDGYPAARARLLGELARRRVPGAMIIGGDVHSNWVGDVLANFDDPRSPVIATEFCGTSITSPGLAAPFLQTIKDENAHLKFVDGSRRGYVLVDLARDAATVRLRVVDDARDPKTAASTQATFRVDAQRPGARRSG